MTPGRSIYPFGIYQGAAPDEGAMAAQTAWT